MIVDSQVHLWCAETPDRPWPAGGAERAHSPQPMTYEAMLTLMDGAGVDRVVIVPPSWEGDRNDYALEAAARHPDRFAVMGRIALKDPASKALLPGWRKQPGMLGIRLTFMEGQAAWLDDGTADWLWPAAEKAGVPIMLHARGKMAKLAEIAARHEGLTLIVDHMGLNYKMSKDGRNAEGIAEVVPLAARPNICVKLSSVPTYSHTPYPFPDMDEHVRRVVDAFGAKRCFWGTDFTHSPHKCSYAQRKTHFTEHLPFLSAADKEKIMGQALLACLGWTKTKANEAV
jgi:predicted TIM-barrel fold metal-dependent hydrolase